MEKKDTDENLAFVFPPNLSKRIKAMQKQMGARSAGEVLVKALSLLEISMGRKVEIFGDDSHKWEIEGFEKLEKKLELTKD